MPNNGGGQLVTGAGLSLPAQGPVHPGFKADWPARHRETNAPLQRAFCGLNCGCSIGPPTLDY